ncbi:MAG: ABC transporter ATP-binding protein [Bacteroidaceae bacterium]
MNKKIKWLFFEPKPTIYPTSTILKWLWTQFKENRIQAFLNMFIGVFIIGLDFFFVWCTKLCIDIATHQNHNFTLSFMTLLLVSTIILQITLSFANRRVRAIFGVQAQNRMQRTLFGHLLMSEWNGMEHFHSGDILNRIEKDVSSIITFVTESIPSLVTIIVQLAGAFIFLFTLDRILACVIVMLFPCFIIISKIYVYPMHLIIRSIRQTESNIQSIIQESIQHHTVAQALQQNHHLFSNLSLMQNHLKQQVCKKTAYSSTSSAIVSIGFAAGYLFAFLWGIDGLNLGTVTYGTLIAFIQLVGQIQNPARSLTHYVPILISTITASERLLQLMNIPREQPGHHRILQDAIGIRLSHIEYHYENQPPVLKNFSYNFVPGSRTIIMGETGSGKTTLIRLLLSLVIPQKGTANIYNHNQSLPIDASTRACFSYVPQGNTLYSGTIRSNLLFGNPNATTEEMEHALHMACADFVFELPLLLDTYCGEHGFGLSEGQAQRICLARAFLRKGQILLLDEATSALDTQTEIHILQNIIYFFSNHTLIIVSHHENIAHFCTNKLILKRILPCQS